MSTGYPRPNQPRWGARGERRAGWMRCGDLSRHAEMPEDPADDGRLLDERDQTQAAASTSNLNVRAMSDAQHWPRA